MYPSISLMSENKRTENMAFIRNNQIQLFGLCHCGLVPHPYTLLVAAINLNPVPCTPLSDNTDGISIAIQLWEHCVARSSQQAEDILSDQPYLCTS